MSVEWSGRANAARARRWKRSSGQPTHIPLGSSTALQIEAQLLDKQRALALFFDFLRATGLWQRLGLVTVGMWTLPSVVRAKVERRGTCKGKSTALTCKLTYMLLKIYGYKNLKLNS